ncbi:putative Transforming protein RhoA [Blattamonas nauphoetae]|uniref:Transforming protein RhoA n=1 Tax=Blattamonas nauphoetae TaxID=2049346 RepID=A0ABQ9WU61_9EUKA|nr:putative Transforming protein RhoA [Blattamonas nauphoetae]
MLLIFDSSTVCRFQEAKVVCIGDPPEDKTSVLISKDPNQASDTYIPEVADNFETSIEVDGQKIKLQLWDTTGSEEYDRLRRLHYSETEVFMLFFSVINEESFKKIETKFHPDISEYLNNAHAVLVGTHSDARASPPDGVTLVSKEQAEQLVEKLKLFGYVECSTTTKEGLPEVFETAARAALQIVSSRDASAGGDCDKEKSGCEIM